MQPKYSSNNKKNYPSELRSAWVPPNNLDYPIIWHLFGPVGAGLTEFYCQTVSYQESSYKLQICPTSIQVPTVFQSQKQSFERYGSIFAHKRQMGYWVLHNTCQEMYIFIK